MMKTVILFLSVFFLFGCMEKQEDFTYYTFADFPHHSQLESDIIDLGEIFYPKEYILMNDSLVLMPQTKSDSCYMHIVNIKNKEFVYQFGMRGRAPNEFLAMGVMTDFRYSPIFYIIDRGAFVEVNLDSLLKLREKYIFHKIPFSHYVNSPAICRYDSSYFLSQNKYYFDHKKYNNPVERFVKIDLARDSAFSREISFDSTVNYFVANVNLYWLVPNTKNNKLWCLGAAEDRIDIFDLDSLHWKKTLKGPVDFSIQYKVATGIANYPLVMDRGWHTAFTNAFATDSCIYVLFANRNYRTYSEDLQNITDKSEILKFDWEGQLLHRYELDRFVVNLTMDSKGEYFYCTAVKNYALTPEFVKYRIK